MPPFRNVNGGRAGPQAVGILVPPGNRTVVVLRPRALALDLVLVQQRTDGEPAGGFFETSRQTAGIEAQKLARALVECTANVRALPVAEGLHVQAEIGDALLIACPRIAGQPYRPKVYPDVEAAQRDADALRGFLCPGPDAEQELYTNLSQFGIMKPETRNQKPESGH